MAALSFENLKPNVSGADSDMVRIPNAEMDVSDVRFILCHDLKVVGGNEAPGGIARLDCNEP